MQDGRSYHLNPMESKHTFDISAFVCAYFFTAKPQFVPRPETYDFSQIFLVLEGSGSYETEHGSYPISPGSMFYRPAGRTSTYRWESEKVRFGIVSFACPSSAMSAFEGAPLFLYEEEIATLLDVIKTGVRICEPLSHDQPLLGMRYHPDTPNAVLDFLRASLERFFTMLYCRLEGIDLLREQTEKVSQFLDTSTLVEDVKSYLANHLSEQLSISDICTAFGVGQTALSKKFRAETKKGVIEYFMDLKIGDARQKIRQSRLSFAQISESLGFSTPNYFSKVFKQKTGLTPTEYSRFVSKRERPAQEEESKGD